MSSFQDAMSSVFGNALGNDTGVSPGMLSGPSFDGLNSISGMQFSDPAQPPSGVAPAPSLGLTDAFAAGAALSGVALGMTTGDFALAGLAGLAGAPSLGAAIGALGASPGVMAGTEDDVSAMQNGMTNADLAGYNGQPGASFGNDFGGSDYGGYGGYGGDPNSGLGGLY